MARESTVIGRGTVVRARISGEGDLDVQGRVEGEVSTDGEVIVAADGLVGANITARRIVVRGAIRGDLVAEEGVHLEDGARVAGDVRAPRVSISPGALLRGYVQTGAAGSAAKPATHAAARQQPKVAPSPHEPPKAAARAGKRAPAAPAGLARPGPSAIVPAIARAAGKKPPPIALAGGKSKAPAPIVPVLRKGAKGSLKKRA